MTFISHLKKNWCDSILAFLLNYLKKNQSIPQGIPLDIPALFLAKDQNTGKNPGHYSGTTLLYNK